MKAIGLRFMLFVVTMALGACGSAAGSGPGADSAGDGLDAGDAPVVQDVAAADTLPAEVAAIADVASLDAASLDAASDSGAGDGAAVTDTGDAKSQDGEPQADATLVDAPAPDAPATDVVSACPGTIQPGAVCAGAQKCEIGTECCCGKCYPSMVCNCGGGSWNCYATDACMIPGCPDAGTTSDATVSPDTAGGVPWTMFKVVKGYGPCPPGNVCSTTWTLTSDGAITIEKGTMGSATKLTAEDFAAANAILSDPGFLGLMKNGFVCGMPPTDVGIFFTLALSGVIYSQNVTGCTFAGGQDAAPAKTLDALVMKY